jgi:hypothetical protein
MLLFKNLDKNAKFSPDGQFVKDYQRFNLDYDYEDINISQSLN